MDEEVRRIKEKWDKSGSIYDRSVTEAQVNIWTLLSRLKELEEGIEQYLDDPEFNTDILTKLIEKEK